MFPTEIKQLSYNIKNNHTTSLHDYGETRKTQNLSVIMSDTETRHYTTTHKNKQNTETDYPPLPAKMTIASLQIIIFPCLLLCVPPFREKLKINLVIKLLLLLNSIKSRIKP